MKSTIWIAVVCVGLAISGCGGGGTSSNSTSSGSTAAAEATGSNSVGVKEIAGKTKPAVEVPDTPEPKKLVVKDLEVGQGRKATVGDEIEIEYVGIHWNGEPYVDSWAYSTPSTFELGGNGPRLDYGLDLGLRGMHVGGRREVIMPEKIISWPDEPHGLVNPVNTFVFVVDLLDVR